MIEPFTGVLLSPGDAATVVDALEVFDQVLAERGSRPSAKLDSLKARLTRAITDVSTPGTDEDARNQTGQSDSGVDQGYELIDSARVAAILGITAGGVRDLARRGRLPAVRAGGRWLYPSKSVLAYAASRCP